MLPFERANKIDIPATEDVNPISMRPIANPIDLSTQSLSKKTTSRSATQVLLVEDNSVAEIAGRILLERLKCSVDVAKTGHAAVEKAQTGNYDLILMDVGLPDFDGIEATKRIRALTDPKYSALPIVALTGHSDVSERKQACLEAGMQVVLGKPAQLSILKDILERFVQNPASTTR